MKNLLKLHEAIAIALLNQDDRSGSFDEIAEVIETRQLFPIRKGNISLSKQVMLRSTKSNQRYSHWFEPVEKDKIKLRNI